MKSIKPPKLVLIIMDALRRDVFYQALKNGDLKNIAQILERNCWHEGLDFPVLSTVPSITFCCNASIFSGAAPARHGITGNVFFDRLGTTQSSSKPRLYEFDAKNFMSLADNLSLYIGRGRLNTLLPKSLTTIFEDIKGASAAFNHTFARGATYWHHPNILTLGRVVIGGKFGLAPEVLDKKMVSVALNYLKNNGMPELLSCYFMGTDLYGHTGGVASQRSYLVEHVDPMIGQIFNAVNQHSRGERVIYCFLSDHGIIDLKGTPSHSIPLEETVKSYNQKNKSNINLKCALNGLMAQIYLGRSNWNQPLEKKELLDVVSNLVSNLEDKINLDSEVFLRHIFIRITNQASWQDEYWCYSKGELIELSSIVELDKELKSINLELGLAELSCSRSGDILLFANGKEGFQFDSQKKGSHGGISPEEMNSVMSIGAPGVETEKMVNIVADAENRSSSMNSKIETITDSGRAFLEIRNCFH